MDDLRAILKESQILSDGPWTWECNEGEDGHWDNTFLVMGSEGEFFAECQFRPHAELLVAAKNLLPDLLAEVDRLRDGIAAHQKTTLDQAATWDGVSEYPVEHAFNDTTLWKLIGDDDA